MTEHKNVYVALAAAQMQMGKAVKGAQNPHFKSKYADLADVVEATRPALNAHGLCFFHVPHQSEFGHGMKTILVHGASDTQIEADVPLIIGKQDMQGYKSATTYAKRIGLESVTGIAPEDDDGNAAAATMNGATKAIADAWKDSVLDSLPADASDRDKANAFAQQIIADMQKPKKMATVDGVWRKREKLIHSLETRFPDLWGDVLEAYEKKKQELEPVAAE